ncbi:hypothetical protein COU37_00610 [Candidatus Micrarchaeota archaeon CG10_big_fil_rev_8_21_14_0_10_45_29]|nr:MAG: hypothetical protein COU37_00610 [Candidatus Micrarchaeota archaeon CG10_big_fil_rev_8_21_14_0_10_45_29]
MKNLFFAIIFSFVILGGFAFAQHDANTCIDGTPAGKCAYEKPKYCTVGLNLENNIDMCGCPEGMVPNVAKTTCIKKSESSLVGDLYFISGSPFDAYGVNPIAYVENPIYKQRTGEKTSAPAAPAAVKSAEEGQVAPETYLPKTSSIEEETPVAIIEEQKEAEPTLVIEEAQETVSEGAADVLDAQKEIAEETITEEQKAQAEQTQEAGIADEQNMDSKEVVSEQIKSVYIKEEPLPKIKEEKSPEDEARDKMYMLVALALIVAGAIYYWIMPKNL